MAIGLKDHWQRKSEEAGARGRLKRGRNTLQSRSKIRMLSCTIHGC